MVQRHHYMKKAAAPTKAELHWEELVANTKSCIVGTYDIPISEQKNVGVPMEHLHEHKGKLSQKMQRSIDHSPGSIEYYYSKNNILNATSDVYRSVETNPNSHEQYVIHHHKDHHKKGSRHHRSDGENFDSDGQLIRDDQNQSMANRIFNDGRNQKIVHNMQTKLHPGQLDLPKLASKFTNSDENLASMTNGLNREVQEELDAATVNDLLKSDYSKIAKHGWNFIRTLRGK